MSGAMVHRGTATAREWSGEALALGMRSLPTTPESRREQQPVALDEDRYVIVADARIDNRESLLATLGTDRQQASSMTDAELILTCYRRWGSECVARLLGDYALAIWDASRQTMLCARDHFGVRPLYYFYRPGEVFAFASEIPALLSHEAVSKEINELEVARHLGLPLETDLGATYYSSIRKLPPSHVLTISIGGGLSEKRYWQLDPLREVTYETDDEYAGALRSAFVEAVRCRTRSATPVASMLSGGIDSSAITVVAARLLEQEDRGPLHTLSAVYPQIPESDESRYIQEVLKRCKTASYQMEGDSLSPIAEIDRMNAIVGGATWGPNLYLNWHLYGASAERGARVVLDGYDGDITLSHGKGYLLELATAGRWLKLGREAVPYSHRSGTAAIPAYAGLVDFGLRHRHGNSLALRLARRLVRRDRESSWSRSASSRNRTVNEEFASRFTDRISETPEPGFTERHYHWRSLNRQMLLETLGWIEALGAGRGVEVRFPFFDVRLVELCLAFPGPQKLRSGWTRYGFRRAMEGILPTAIQWRQAKTDLRAGWNHAYRRHAGHRIESLLNAENSLAERYLDFKGLRALYGEYMASRLGAPEESALWRALSLALWLDAVDNRRVR
jgi:asparagine synthase (glutamine-hydrolysing)